MYDADGELSPQKQVVSNVSAYWKFFGCSVIGISLFLIPVTHQGDSTIILGVMATTLQQWIGEKMPYFTTPLFVCGMLLAIIYNLPPRKFVERLPFCEQFIASHWIAVVLSIGSGVFSLMTFFQVGPEWIVKKETGITAYVDVAGIIFLLIGLGCLFLPFLTDYGLLEFFGTLLQRSFKKIFNLPGRAMIDTLASWVGASSVAVIVTSGQYAKGYYTAREAAVICTNFSVVSVGFVVFTAQISNLSEYFFELYGSMFLVCMLCAFIMPKLPPLRGIKDDYYEVVGKQFHDDEVCDSSKLKVAYHRAMEVARSANEPLVALKKGFFQMLDIFFMMMPAGMTIEFITLVVYHETSFFHILSYPIIPVLDLLQIPDSIAASPGVLVGLLDQFVPAIMAGNMQDPVTRFVLAGLSLTQLIFFAESAILIVRSKIPLSISQLVGIFFLRTVVALPVLTIIAHCLF